MNIDLDTPQLLAIAAALGWASGLRLVSDGAALWLIAADGSALKVLAARRDGDAQPLDAGCFEALHAGRWVAADT